MIICVKKYCAWGRSKFILSKNEKIQTKESGSYDFLIDKYRDTDYNALKDYIVIWGIQMGNSNDN